MAASAKVAAQTDILRTMEMVGDVSAKAEKSSGRKKTPPSGSQKSSENQRKIDMIKELGRKPSQEKIRLYTRKSESPEKRLSEERLSAERENVTNSLPTTSKQFMMDRLSMEVPTDILNTIQEERTKSPSDGGSINERKDSAESVSNSSIQPTIGQRLADKRGKYPFNR